MVEMKSSIDIDTGHWENHSESGGKKKKKRESREIKKITLQDQCRRPTLQIIVITHERVWQKFPEEHEFPGLNGWKCNGSNPPKVNTWPWISKILGQREESVSIASKGE